MVAVGCEGKDGGKRSLLQDGSMVFLSGDDAGTSTKFDGRRRQRGVRAFQIRCGALCVAAAQSMSSKIVRK